MAQLTSLLHATYRAGDRAVDVRRAWLDAAAAPDRVEHIFGLDADDHVSMRATNGLRRVVSDPLPGRVTAVRNWNAAAAEASGDLLFVIADDLLPPPAWDTKLRRFIGSLDPLSVRFAVKINDGERPGPEALLCHPVVSRAFYESLGLFDSRFDGVYCDDDISRRAFWRAAILDGRSLRFDHRHPDTGAERSESHSLMNTSVNFVDGYRTLGMIWGRRTPWPVLLASPAVARSARTLALFSVALRVSSAMMGLREAVNRRRR